MLGASAPKRLRSGPGELERPSLRDYEVRCDAEEIRERHAEPGGDRRGGSADHEVDVVVSVSATGRQCDQCCAAPVSRTELRAAERADAHEQRVIAFADEFDEAGSLVKQRHHEVSQRVGVRHDGPVGWAVEILAVEEAHGHGSLTLGAQPSNRSAFRSVEEGHDLLDGPDVIRDPGGRSHAGARGARVRGVAERRDPACPKLGGFWFNLYGVVFYLSLAAALVWSLWPN